MMQGRVKTKGILQPVLNTTTGLPQSLFSSSQSLPPLVIPKYSPPPSSLIWISVRRMNAGGWGGGEWTQDFPRIRLTLLVGHEMIEGLQWSGYWDTGGVNWGGLVPSTTGSGGVGVWVLEVNSPVPCCMCGVLGVCFWHLFCYGKKRGLSAKRTMTKLSALRRLSCHWKALG